MHLFRFSSTREYGREWLRSAASAVLRVPSAVIATEFNYVINVRHPQFALISFGAPEPFRFDSRLK